MVKAEIISLPDRKILRQKLNGFPSDSVTKFIYELDFILKIYPHFGNALDEREHSDRLSKALDSFKVTVRELKYYGKTGTPLPQRHFDHACGEEAARRLDAMYFTVNDAAEAATPLLRLIERFSATLSEHKKRGRGRTPADKTGLVREIVTAFEKHLELANTSKTHPLFEVVQVVLRTAGLPDKDPSRAIKAALALRQK